MKATWHVMASVLVALTLASGAMSQEKAVEPKPTKQKPAASTLQLLNENLQTIQLKEDAGSLLALELATTLVSSNDLGVDVAELQAALRSQLGVGEGIGLVVTSVPDDCPGAKAGLKPHDVLVKIGEAAVGNKEQLAEALQRAEGKLVKLEVIRHGKVLSVEATPKNPKLAEMVLADTPVRVWSHLLVNEERYRMGVVLAEADDTLRAQVGLAAGEGLIVTEVHPDTPAAKAGIQVHDVFVILDGKRLSTVDAINAQIQEIKDRQVELKLMRSGKEVALKIAPAKEAAATFADFDRQALTIWNAGGCPAQVQTFNCKSCHQAPFPDQHWKADRFHAYDALRQWITRQPAAAGSPQEQVNQLKEQLAKMQETLSTLEASLAASATKEKDAQKEQDGKQDK